MASNVQPRMTAEFTSMADKPMTASDMAVRAVKISAAFAKDKAFVVVQRKALSLAQRITAVAEKVTKKTNEAAMKATWNNANFADAVAILMQKMTAGV
jgi:hypothetical protein